MILVQQRLPKTLLPQMARQPPSPTLITETHFYESKIWSAGKQHFRGHPVAYDGPNRPCKFVSFTNIKTFT